MPGRGRYWKKGGIKDETIVGQDLAIGFKEIKHFDDFFYDAEPVTKYTTTGTYAAVAGVGGQARWTSGATAGNQAVVQLPQVIDVTKDWLMRVRAAITTADTELFAHIGIFETAPTAADPPVLANDYAAFELIETTLDNDWDAITGEDVGGAGAETTTATTVTGALDVFHDYEISFNAASDLVTFKIDDVVRARHTANIPLVNGTPTIMVTTGDTNAKAINIDSWLVTNSRV